MKTAFSLKSIAICGLLLPAAVQLPQTVSAQGIHFSQYYNAPMLTNPANTGLMSDKDYRVGANYRSQWSSVPVPYHTFSVFGDLQVFRARNQTNWLGLGAAVFNDKAGDGNLSLTRYEAFASYHIELGEYQMISIGGSAASVQRSVDFNKLTWDSQWEGFNFNTALASGETGNVSKTSYTDITAGINYAIFPSELMYVKIGVGLAHINKPKESFYGQTNQLGMRPTGNVDVLARVGTNLIINPSAYYTSQKGASEFMYGSLFIVNVGGESARSRLVLGVYHRWNDAIVGVFGYEWSNLRVMTSYDYTMSELGDYTNHNGALEFGLQWQGTYRNEDAMVRRAYNCPRF
jgi:type IX secretion system PorP/SprF family membrane protein